MSKEDFETCEACLPFKTTEDFENYIERRELEDQLTEAIRNFGAIAVIGLGGTGKSTLVNKVLLDLEEEYKRIDVDLRHVTENPQEAMRYVLGTIVERLAEGRVFESYSKPTIEFAKSLSLSIAGSVSSVSVRDLVNVVKEDEKIDDYVSVIEGLLGNQPITFVVVFDDLVDVRTEDSRGSLVALAEALHQLVNSSKIKFLIVARETKTRGRGLALGKEELLELEDRFACVRIGGFNKLQVKKFIGGVMGFTVEKDEVIDILFRKTQGRPRVLCYALTSFRKKRGKHKICISDATDETEFPSTPKQQLNNYLSEVYGQYKTELVATSILMVLTRDELAYLCSKIGKKLSDADFISFRNSGILEEHEENWFTVKNLYLPLLIDIFESLLDNGERYRYNRLMIDYHRDSNTDRSDIATVFYTKRALEFASPSAIQWLLKVMARSAIRYSNYALKENQYINAFTFGIDAYNAASEMKAHKAALTAALTILTSGLCLEVREEYMHDYYRKAEEQYRSITKKDDYTIMSFVDCCYRYLCYHSQVLLRPEKGFELAKRALAETHKLADRSNQLRTVNLLLHAIIVCFKTLVDVSNEKKYLNVLRENIEEMKKEGIITKNEYSHWAALMEREETRICDFEGDLKGALMHCRRALGYSKSVKESSLKYCVGEYKVAIYALKMGSIRESLDILERVDTKTRLMSLNEKTAVRMALVLAYLVHNDLDKAKILLPELESDVEKFPHLMKHAIFYTTKALLIMKSMCGFTEENDEKAKLSEKLLSDAKEIFEKFRSDNIVCSLAGMLVLRCMIHKKNRDDVLVQLEKLQNHTRNRTKWKILEELMNSVSKSDFAKSIDDLARLAIEP